MNAKDTVVFDLDGTIANIDHRTGLIKKGAPNWDKFFTECVNDTPNQWCLDLLIAMARAGYMIKIVSARSRVVVNESREWLAKHIPPEVGWELCMLRAPGEYTPDTTLKKAWLDQFGRDRILFVVDDRARVVNMWREEGLVCLQCSDWEEKEKAARQEKRK